MPKWTSEQSSAINLDHSNIIVSAGAGSGKTAVLTARVIRKLEEGVHINELLILTFTNAAAFEMKERIRKAIKKEPKLAGELELLPSSYITTFDSYAMSVVKKYHYLLNVSPNVAIATDTMMKAQKEKIINEILIEYYEQNDPKFAKLINDFFVKDDQNFQKYLYNFAESLSLLSNKEEYLDNYIDTMYDSQKIVEDITAFEELLQDKLSEIAYHLQELASVADTDYYSVVNMTLEPLLHSYTYQEILENLSIYLPRIPKNTPEEVKTVKDKIKANIDKLQEMCIYDSFWEMKELYQRTKPYLEVIIDILREYYKRLFNYKRQYDIYEFNDIAMMAISLLREHKDVRDEIKDSLNEIMIDEYQDTSDLQEEFISYISNNNVYMVGDIKQSIYRFRNANPYIFKNKYDNYAKGNGGQKIDLKKNFRSRVEVLENINLLFNQVMNDEIGGANYLEEHQMIFGNTTYINEGKTKEDYNMNIYTYNYDKDNGYTKEEIECFIIAKDIIDKINNKYQVFDKDTLEVRDATYSDFVIILDRSSSFDLFKKIFEYHGIPLMILRDEKLNNDKDIYVINNLFKLVIKVSKKEYDREFRYLFISIMRSFLYRESDEIIFEYFQNNGYYDTDLFKKIKNISKELPLMNSKTLLIKLINTFNIYEKLITIGNAYNSIIKIDKLLDLASDLENVSYDVYTFSNYLDKMIKDNYEIKYSTSSNESNAVKIMTIHKSKGLEYHICYFANLYKRFNISDLKDRFLYDNKYGMIIPFFDEGIGETFYKELVKANYVKEEISERIRLFYVAMTRAKEKMIIIKPSHSNEIQSRVNNYVKLNYKSFDDMLESVSPLLKPYTRHWTEEEIGVNHDYNLIRRNNYEKQIKPGNEIIEVQELNLDYQVLTKKSFSKKIHEIITKQEKENLELGLDIHELLELTDFNNHHISNIDNKLYQKIINNFLNQDLIKDRKHAKIYKEFEFIYDIHGEEKHGIIDLMLVYDTYVDIIDYKLKDITDSHYLEQLEGYKNYITKICHKKVNTYLYSILDNKVVKLS